MDGGANRRLNYFLFIVKCCFFFVFFLRLVFESDNSNRVRLCLRLTVCLIVSPELLDASVRQKVSYFP